MPWTDAPGYGHPPLDPATNAAEAKSPEEIITQEASKNQQNTTSSDGALLQASEQRPIADQDSNLDAERQDGASPALPNCRLLTLTSEPATTHLMADTDTILLPAVIRDFKSSKVEGGMPDFQKRHSGFGRRSGILALNLAPDNKPMRGDHADRHLARPELLAHWYRDTTDMNRRFHLQIPLQRSPDGKTFSYENNAFFPINGMGFDSGLERRNFHFTTEIQLRLTYNPNQIFEFEGDDDLWVFVGQKLALDIGGVHGPARESFQMKEFIEANLPQITPGDTLPLSIFHAERHTTQSVFKIRTNIEFEPEP